MTIDRGARTLARAKLVAHILSTASKIYFYCLRKPISPLTMPLKITSACGLALFIIVLGSLNWSVTAGRMLLDKKDSDGKDIQNANPRDLIDLASRLCFFKNDDRDNQVVYGIQLGLYGAVMIATLYFVFNLRSCSGQALNKN